MKPEPEAALHRNVELITIWVGVGVTVASLGALAATRGEFRPIAFISLAVVGAIIAIVGGVELKKVKKT